MIHSPMNQLANKPHQGIAPFIQAIGKTWEECYSDERVKDAGAHHHVAREEFLTSEDNPMNRAEVKLV